MPRLRAPAVITLAAAIVTIALGTAPAARAVWLPQLRLRHIGVVVLQRDGTEVIAMTIDGASGFTLGESSRVSCVVPLPRGARTARSGAVSGTPVSDALAFIASLRAHDSVPLAERPALARVPVGETMVLDGSTAAVDALLRGELRLSGASPPSDEALAAYRQRDWTYLLARAHPTRPPPYALGPIVAAFRAERPAIPVRLLARRPPVDIDIVLVTALQPVLDREALAARGLVYTELVDTPHVAPPPGAPPPTEEDTPLALPYSQLAWSALPASVRSVAAPFASGSPSIAWRDDELVHVAHVVGRLESIERWTDDLVFEITSAAHAAPSIVPAARPDAPPVITAHEEVPTGPPAARTCACDTLGRRVTAREARFAAGTCLALVLGVVARARGRRFSRDPRQAVNRG